MPQLQGLIFDLDGTLLDSAPDLRQALNRTVAAEGGRSLTLDEVKSMTGDGMLPLLGRAFAASGKRLSDAEAYGKFHQFIANYRELKPDPSQIYPNVMETVKAFRQTNVKIGICTNKQEASTIKLLDDLAISSYFDFVAGGDTFPVHKPHPDHVRGVIEALGVPAANCVMVGDSTNDVLAAHGAGIPCILVTHGYGADYDSLGANGMIDGFDKLKAMIVKLGYAIS